MDSELIRLNESNPKTPGTSGGDGRLNESPMAAWNRRFLIIVILALVAMRYRPKRAMQRIGRSSVRLVAAGLPVASLL